MEVRTSSRNASKVSSGFKFIRLLLFCWFRSVRLSMKYTVVFGWTSSKDGRAQFVIFTCLLNCTICARGDEFISTFWHENFLCVECSNKLLNVCRKDVSFSDSGRKQRKANDDAERTF